MKSQIKTWAALLFLAIPIWAQAQKTIELDDPSGKIKVNISIGDNITYSVKHQGDVMIGQSPISMTLADGTVFGRQPRLKKTRKNSVDEKIYPPVYRKKVIENRYNELTFDFSGGYSLVFRAYADGAAYRFVSNLKKPFKVKGEQAVFNLPDDPMVYMPTPRGRDNDGKEDQFYSSFQNVYKHVKLSQWDKSRLAFLPILSEGPNGKKVCITEADLMNYPGMYLNRTSDDKGLGGIFAAYPKDVVVEVRGLKERVTSREDYIAKVEGKTSFPWRVVIVSEEDKDLMDNDMVYKLSTPAPKGDYSWVKPGKVAWDWWNDWNLFNVDFRAGINNETYKYYIDFASKFGIEYVILDEGWAVPGKADLFQIVPEIDLKELISYADSKHVGLILWAGFRAFDKDMDKVCKHYAAMGIKGFKIDFMDRDDQYMVDFNRRCAEVGLKYKLLIDLHGTFKPTGLQRTYPNAVNFEGVHGLEELKWATPETNQVVYDVTVPFIRMVAGPMDYTQGAMDNANKENFHAVYSEPMSQGTRCHQMAEYVVFESPVNMLCDSPSKYLKEQECTKFIASIPTVWDETRPLDSKVGQYAVMARKKGDVWYVGALTNWDARDLELDLSFIGKGTFKVDLFEDGINADRVAKDYKHRTITIDASRKYKIHMASGGGYVMKIYK